MRPSVVQLPAPGRTLNNLPAALTRFVGRRAQMAEARRMLADTRLLTLAGPGGGGKTRLALELAPKLASGFADGVWLVELAAVSRPDLVTQRVAAALGLRESPQRPLDGLAEQLADRRLLLLLDNCEHLVETTARLAESLLQGCPDLYILATSRESLNVPGEVVMRVPALSLPDLDGPLSAAAVGDSEAVALFVERARAVRTDFRLTIQNAAAVARLCVRLEGLPLAIELAAALVRVMSVEEILAGLDHRFDLLVARNSIREGRQRTLRAAIDWSHDLLSRDEQVLFRRLAVFRGGCRRESALAVCADPELPADRASEVIAGLVDKSMLMVATNGPSSRFGMLETLADYARERLAAAGETAALDERHAAHFATLVDLGRDRLPGPQHEAWLMRLEEEQENLRVLLERSLATDAGRALVLATLLGEFWLQRGYLREARHWLDSALGLADASPAERAGALVAVGDIDFYQGDYAAAGARYREAADLARAGGHLAQLGLALVGLGQLAQAEDRPAEARALLEEGLTIQRGLDDRLGVNRALGYLGLLAAAEGRLDEARAVSEESLAISQEIGDTTGTYRALRNLATAAFLGGEAARARELCERGLRLSRELGNQVGIPMWLEGFAALAAADEQHIRALRLAGAAAALRKRMQSTASRPWEAAVTAILEPSRRHLGRRGVEAWSAGEALAAELAIAEALAGAAPVTAGVSLTATQLKVADLVAQGKTDKEIGSALFISRRTASTHVRNIMNKLGHSSRSQIAAWYVEQRFRGS